MMDSKGKRILRGVVQTPVLLPGEMIEEQTVTVRGVDGDMSIFPFYSQISEVVLETKIMETPPATPIYAHECEHCQHHTEVIDSE